jgi:ketosteroid isomerase-like protein
MGEKPATSDLIELTRGLFASASRKDFDAMLAVHSVDAVWDTGLGPFEGVEAIRSFLKDWSRAFDEYQVDVEEAVDLGDGVIFVAVNATGRPVGIDAKVELRQRAWVVRWRNGKVVRAASYFDSHQARAAAERLAQERG